MSVIARTLSVSRSHQIELLFNRLKNWRHVATRHEKTKESYLCFVAIAAVKLGMPFVHER